ncbi:integral membrane sensor signal transduction histidine kinase [Alkaliphilus metalliredigens QYMF]|uniref:histidine kinase n=1 Tax=Alkaliphilus metalliredigens (strain QYMF) TaxID=293826 RepID=A6TNV0_ALKMQ|nr:HAMP domain-containing sensor histidine kinase [Alkaliphilus metalliredigens]ABR47868.1 integral membrane sensor signal transduction histidine kinase [Alkaliphilus metalliredigens QYMF]
MNFKITGRFILTVVFITIIVIIINLSVGIGFIVNRVINSNGEITDSSPENFTREFNKYLMTNQGVVYIHEDGKKILEDEDIWLQVLNEDGNELYNYNKPVDVKESYTPMEMVHAYKYALSESMSTIFIGEKVFDDINYSYILGFPFEKIKRSVISYDIYKVVESIRKGIYIILLIDIPIVLIFGYLFSRRLTKPLIGIINDVEVLSEGEYNLQREEKGVYKQVYRTINNLSAKLRSNEKERRNLDRMREEWILNISHDIKTPLVSIKGYAEILSNEEYNFTDDEIREYGKIIDNKSNYIKELIDDLNLSTRLKNKSLNLDFKNINIVSLVRGVVIDILNNPNTNNVNIEFIVEREIIEKKVDKVLIKRVINNILYNSIVHNNEDVSIEVKVEKKENIHIFIIDNGKGIDDAEIKRIFDRYYRGTNTGAKHKGSGLGMAIARDIVTAHNGSIKIKSQLGEGTEIEVIL